MVEHLRVVVGRTPLTEDIGYFLLSAPSPQSLAKALEEALTINLPMIPYFVLSPPCTSLHFDKGWNKEAERRSPAQIPYLQFQLSGGGVYFGSLKNIFAGGGAEREVQGTPILLHFQKGKFGLFLKMVEERIVLVAVLATSSLFQNWAEQEGRSRQGLMKAQWGSACGGDQRVQEATCSHTLLEPAISPFLRGGLALLSVYVLFPFISVLLFPLHIQFFPHITPK